jgi:hypothetical protein
MFFASSHVSQPTRRLQRIPLQPFLPFSALVPLRYLSITPTLNTFVPLTQWSTSCSPLFVGKTHQVMSHLARFAADLAALHPTRLKDWIRGYPAVLPEPATRSRKHESLQLRRRARTVGVVSVRGNVRVYTPDLVKTAASLETLPPSGVAVPQRYSHNLAIGSEWLHRRSN